MPLRPIIGREPAKIIRFKGRVRQYRVNPDDAAIFYSSNCDGEFFNGIRIPINVLDIISLQQLQRFTKKECENSAKDHRILPKDMGGQYEKNALP